MRYACMALWPLKSQWLTKRTFLISRGDSVVGGGILERLAVGAARSADSSASARTSASVSSGSSEGSGGKARGILIRERRQRLNDRAQRVWPKARRRAATRLRASRSNVPPQRSPDERSLAGCADHVSGRANCPDDPVFEQQHAIAEASQEILLMRDQDDRLPLLLEAVERSEALLLEAFVAHREHLVEQEHVERNLDCDRVREPHQHARG